VVKSFKILTSQVFHHLQDIGGDCGLIFHCSKYPQAGTLHHIWVAKTWASDIGLPQLADTLLMNLVDGRVLNSFSKDDLRKYLKINRKIEQVSC